MEKSREQLAAQLREWATVLDTMPDIDEFTNHTNDWVDRLNLLRLNAYVALHELATHYDGQNPEGILAHDEVGGRETE